MQLDILGGRNKQNPPVVSKFILAEQIRTQNGLANLGLLESLKNFTIARFEVAESRMLSSTSRRLSCHL